MVKYAEQERILGERNSYSKTDLDATFMRMKEDHMRNGQLKPAYNVQLSSHDQFIVNYSLHQNPTDTRTLKSHLESYHRLYDQYPKVLVAGAGYGSEENYALLKRNGIDGYVKHNQFDREQHQKHTDWFKTENLEYNQKADIVYCPIGEPMKRNGYTIRNNKSGFKQKYAIYQASKCQNCPVRDTCHSQNGNRIVEINHRLRKMKAEANAKLKSTKGIAYRKKRPADIEPVFAQLKHNKNFKRFMLKGLKKVEIETGLLAIAHNLAKLAT
jgi:endonuclease III